MKASEQQGSPEIGSDSHCLVKAVASAFADQPELEAVTIDRSSDSLAVATLGITDSNAVQTKVAQAIELAQSNTLGKRCGLLEGTPNCGTCGVVMSQDVRDAMRIEHSKDATTIARVTCPTAPKMWRWHRIPFPKFVQRDVEFLEEAEHAEEWKPQLLAAALCGVLALGARFAPPSASPWLHVLAYLCGGWFAAIDVWERLRQRSIDVHFLMLAVAAGSASIGAWSEGAVLLFLFSLSGALEHYALGRTQKEISALFRAAPKAATVVELDGHEKMVPIADLRPGMTLLVKPGDQFAVDAEITKGKTAADESTLTGEAVPVEKQVGDVVLAGTINIWGAVEATVIRRADESALQKIIRLIREAQHQKAPVQRFTDRFSSIYTYVVLSASLAMFFVWWLAFGLEPFESVGAARSAFYRTMTLLVVASPCALVLSIPSAVLAAIARGARKGILFRGGAAVEKLAEVSVAALDKTGTLTTGELRVEVVESYPAGREAEVAQIACSLERLSQHPLARAINRYAKQNAVSLLQFDHFESMTGLGLRGMLGARTLLLGNRRLFEAGAHGQIISSVAPTEAGMSEVWIADGELLGRIILRDDIRVQARSVVDALRAEGLHTVVLTGDRHSAAEHLRAALDLDEVRSDLKPEDKVAAIRSFSESGRLVAMIGDGVNDAPALAAAHVGVAMGARGSDAALEQADIVLMHDRLENFLTAFRLSRRARAIIRQNLIVSLGTVAVLVTLALAGIVPLTLGVIGHEGSTVIVVMNSLRLLFHNTGDQ